MVKIKTILKIVFSLGLLAYLINMADPEKIFAIISRIWTGGRLIYVILAILTFSIAILVYAYRWQVLLKGYNIHVGVFKLFKFYLIGLFFNNFLPTGIGGDITRIYNLIQEAGDRTIGFASVMTERLLGITSTLILTLFSLTWLLGSFSTNRILYINVILLIFILLFFYLVFNRKYPESWAEKIKKIQLFKFGERIDKLFEAIRYFHDKKIVYVKVISISLFAQALVIMMHYFCILALDLDVSVLYLFLVVPVTFLLTMLPSINGLGVRDGGFVFLLGKKGISTAAALSLSFLAIIVPMIVSIAGAILFAMQKKKAKIGDIKSVEKTV
jgi:glycosyltransferase 2 family protein